MSMTDEEIKALSADEARTKIYELTGTAHEAIKLACKLATEHKINFDFSVTYGMGGEFVGNPEYNGDDHVGWYPSSHSC